MVHDVSLTNGAKSSTLVWACHRMRRLVMMIGEAEEAFKSDGVPS